MKITKCVCVKLDLNQYGLINIKTHILFIIIEVPEEVYLRSDSELNHNVLLPWLTTIFSINSQALKKTGLRITEELMSFQLTALG